MTGVQTCALPICVESAGENSSPSRAEREGARGRANHPERSLRANALESAPASLQNQPLSVFDPELLAARPIIEAQQRISRIPAHDELLAETTRTREGFHLFLFPFEGRLVHAGLAALLALRLTRRRSASFSISVGDYGLEILSASEFPFAQLLDASLFSRDNLIEDIAQSVNMTQLARLAFRDVARVAGLVFQNHPGARKTGRQLQAGSSLVFDVLSDFDPANLFLLQSRREVLDRHFERSRLSRTLARLASARLLLVNTPRLTPLSFPLVIERVATRLTSRTLLERLEAMRRQWRSHSP